ncbi:hypothetical protein [Anaeromyxobacter oryzae]|uniref:Porin n=1 Tax=Anaeromyxobacter oryzae TaxID=2918170 RepID=A0ABM7WQB8_9BACT|nr:hypothetical protein [Anaeromyxobacter oryzae]BDG01659.1 hypothetical protein AMOR_06550 [Anaeromyxobacter oryzae]
MKPVKKLVAAALAASLPLAALAQTTPAEPAKPAETAPAATPAPAPKPADDTMKVTPYGFVLVNAFFDGDTFTTRDYPGQVAGANAGGAFLMSARQSRFGVRLAGKDTAFTGADLSGVIEFDFKAGHLPTSATCPAGGGACTITTANTPSTSWYNGLMRLRLASATASWKFSGGQSFAILGGQDYGLVNPLFAESLAWVADPLFWQAGNLWRRGPQFRGTYTGAFGGLGLQLAAAIVSPADGFTPVDNGAGNRSRMPDVEGRAAVSYKASPDMNGTVGVAYSYGKRRFDTTATYTGNTRDITVDVFGVDAEINVPYLTAKGEYYTGKGMDDTYNGILSPGVQGSLGATTDTRRAINSDGYWAQGILKPLPAVWVTIGYGLGEAKDADLTSAASAAGTRRKSTQLAGGVIFNAGKWWRFGVEAIKVETTTHGNSFNGATANKDDATQVAISSQLKF